MVKNVHNISFFLINRQKKSYTGSIYVKPLLIATDISGLWLGHYYCDVNWFLTSYWELLFT